MEIIDNIHKTLKEDLVVELREGCKLSIAASCFSIYAFQELKEQLKDIEELRFVFTSPTFPTEKASKQKREFYIPRLNRERNLYGSEFEVKFHNALTQRVVAKEFAKCVLIVAARCINETAVSRVEKPAIKSQKNRNRNNMPA